LLQPQNLLLTGAYPECDIKLCDFGISRVIQSGVEVREILGTPDYVGMLYDRLHSTCSVAPFVAVLNARLFESGFEFLFMLWRCLLQIQT